MVSTSWKRRSFVTRSADPTEVVEWHNTMSLINIQEFQNIYTVTQNGLAVADSSNYWTNKHRDLEHRWQEEQVGFTSFKHSSDQRRLDSNISTLHADIAIAKMTKDANTAAMYERFIVVDIKRIMWWYRAINSQG